MVGSGPDPLRKEGACREPIANGVTRRRGPDVLRLVGVEPKGRIS